MDAKQGFGTLIQAAADLVNHSFLPSWVAEDYPTKTMSTAKVAQRMGDASEQLKLLAMRVRQGADAMVAEVDAKQAKIDALMLEFCPDEMTPEQRENWARAQRRVPRTFGGDEASQGKERRDDAATIRATAGTQHRTISMTGQQVMDALYLVAPDCFQVVNRDSEVEFARETFREQMESGITIGFVEAHVTNEGEERPAGLYGWLTEHPEEGSVQLGGEEGQAEVHQEPGVLVVPMGARATGAVPEGEGLIFDRAKWPSLEAATRTNERDSRLLAHGKVPVMDERGEDYVFHLTVHTADPDAERLLAALCTRAVNSVPRVIDAMDFALRKLRSVEHLVKKGDTSVAKQSLEAALEALTGKSAVGEEGTAP
jgi:hypothetical protein